MTHCSLQQRVKSARRIICTGTPENGGMARAFPPLPFQKSGNGSGGAFSSYRCRNRQIFGVRRILPEFPRNFPEKFFVQLLATSILPQRSRKPPLFGVTSKKGLHVFSANLGCHCLKSNNAGRHFYPDFQDFCPDLSNQNF